MVVRVAVRIRVTRNGAARACLLVAAGDVAAVSEATNVAARNASAAQIAHLEAVAIHTVVALFIVCNMHASSRGTIAAIVCAREAVVARAIVVARNVCDRGRDAGVWERPGVGDSRVFNEGVVSEGTLFA